MTEPAEGDARTCAQAAATPALEISREMIGALAHTASLGVTVPVLCQAQTHCFPRKRVRLKGLWSYKLWMQTAGFPAEAMPTWPPPAAPSGPPRVALRGPRRGSLPALPGRLADGP